MKTKAEKCLDLSNGERAMLHMYIYDVIEESVEWMTFKEQYMIYETMAFQMHKLNRSFTKLGNALKPKTTKEIIFYFIFIIIGIILLNDSLYYLFFWNLWQ